MILGQFLQGASVSELTKFWGVHLSTIYRWINNVFETQKLFPKKATGHPGKLIKVEKKLLFGWFERYPCKPARFFRQSIFNNFSKIVAVRTVRFWRKKFGFYRVKVLNPPMLSPEDKLNRLEFVIKNIFRNWENWIFTDESMIQIFRNTGYCFIKSPKDRIKKPKPNYITKVMIWGGISWCGKTKIYFFDHFKEKKQRINSQIYIKVIKKAIQEIKKIYKKKEWFFIQDNAPIHKSKITMKFFKNRKIHLIEWPRRSPDLNPIEMVWSYLKFKVEQRTPKKKEELIKFIIEEWDSITLLQIRNFINHMKKELINVMSNNGGFKGKEYVY